jgi:hypothetical protein
MPTIVPTTHKSVIRIGSKLTSRLLPDCRLDVRENDVHFSQEVIEDFASTLMAGRYQKNPN